MRRLVMVATLCMVSAAAWAQSLWTSAELKVPVVKGFSGSFEAEYRTQDAFAASERWAGTLSFDYKPVKYFRLSAGYTFIYKHTPEETTKKGNIVSDYWQPRNRAFVSATGLVKWGRFEFSLRERYQYTHSGEISVPKTDSEGNSKKNDEFIDAKDRHPLRSRLEIDWNIRKSRFTPFVSAEIYNSLTDRFSYQKTRVSVGTDIKLNKHNTLTVFYRYIDR
ncbi:MAG: DUF2490 domain-containing protein, partial [Bacteroidales bacterium]|nr:DUF2490 domain-containing protein [Bacteroidales bacterium]